MRTITEKIQSLIGVLKDSEAEQTKKLMSDYVYEFNWATPGSIYKTKIKLNRMQLLFHGIEEIIEYGKQQNQNSTNDVLAYISKKRNALIKQLLETSPNEQSTSLFSRIGTLLQTEVNQELVAEFGNLIEGIEQGYYECN